MYNNVWIKNGRRPYEITRGAQMEVSKHATLKAELEIFEARMQHQMKMAKLRRCCRFADSTVSIGSAVLGVGHRISWSCITFPLSVGVADIWMIDHVYHNNQLKLNLHSIASNARLAVCWSMSEQRQPKRCGVEGPEVGLAGDIWHAGESQAAQSSWELMM
jgi:hypothetical protein